MLSLMLKGTVCFHPTPRSLFHGLFLHILHDSCGACLVLASYLDHEASGNLCSAMHHFIACVYLFQFPSSFLPSLSLLPLSPVSLAVCVEFSLGVVTTGDLGRVMRAVGLEPSDDELANMITEVDGSGKGAVDFAEFMKMMSMNGIVIDPLPTVATADLRSALALLLEPNPTCTDRARESATGG